MKTLFSTLFALLASVAANSAAPRHFSFNERGEFTIVQFTDLHWDPLSPTRHNTTRTMKSVIAAEKPDLIILTGDIVTSVPAVQGWEEVTATLIASGIPWTATLGNHDDEPGISRTEIFNLLKGKPNFVGGGDHSIPIFNKAGESISSVIYCIDSNGYAPLSKYGHYDWIHFDQIEWYRRQSKHYTAQNGGKPLPSLAFFHIPTPEFLNIADKSVGTKNEGVASADINSGFFASMIDMGDVMGAFVGHDHDNDYIGKEFDIALAFGRVTGGDAYGDLTRGARVVRLYENAFRFDTWIRTNEGVENMYYFPSGLTRDEEQTMNYLPATEAAPQQHGVRYDYYEGNFQSVDELASAPIAASGTADNISLEPARARDHFGLRFESWVYIPQRGVYNVYIVSDDGAQMFIDEQLVVDNDGSHSSARSDGKVALEKGFHKLRLLYFEDYMGEVLEVGFSSRNLREQRIPDEVLFL